MIGKLTGTLAGKTPEGAALIEVGGVGYVVRCPGILLAAITAAQDVSLFIHTAVRDDAIDLYGFPTEEDLSFFKQLMSVSGVGPKTALGIMSVADAAVLRRAIAAGDAAALTKVFGIGKKSAERIVVELRDKLAAQTQMGAAYAGGDDGEVIEALMALGYRAEEARQALKDIGDSGSDVRSRLSASLKQLAGGARKTV